MAKASVGVSEGDHGGFLAAVVFPGLFYHVERDPDYEAGCDPGRPGVEEAFEVFGAFGAMSGIRNWKTPKATPSRHVPEAQVLLTRVLSQMETEKASMGKYGCGKHRRYSTVIYCSPFRSPLLLTPFITGRFLTVFLFVLVQMGVLVLKIINLS